MLDIDNGITMHIMIVLKRKEISIRAGSIVVRMIM
jgi:hypothetical protein